MISPICRPLGSENTYSQGCARGAVEAERMRFVARISRRATSALASTFMRDERTPAAQAPACGSATRQQWPPQSSAAFGPRAQRVTDHSLVAADIGLHQGTPIVTRCPLPAHAASLGDQLQVPVALRR